MSSLHHSSVYIHCFPRCTLSRPRLKQSDTLAWWQPRSRSSSLPVTWNRDWSPGISWNGTETTRSACCFFATLQLVHTHFPSLSFPPSLSFLSMQLGTRESWQIFYPPEFEIVEFFSTRSKIGAYLCKPHPFVIGFRVRFLSHTSQLQQRNLVLEVNFLTRTLFVLFHKLHSFCCWRV